MKKLLVVMLVLSMASMANAALWITVNGGTDEVTLNVGDTATLALVGDGATGNNTFYAGIDSASAGDGSIDIGSATVLYTGSEASIGWAGLTGGEFWNRGDAVGMSLTDAAHNPQAPLSGTLFGSIVFTCASVGDVTVNLADIDFNIIGSTIIHQVPEPITIGLLGLGGLFLRRRK